MPKYFDLNEPTVAAMQAHLQETVPPIIDEINATSTDGVVVDYPVQVLDYVPSLVELDGIGYPCVAIMDGDIHLEDDIGVGATVVMDLAVVVFVQGVDQRTLAVSLRRWARVLTNAALGGPARQLDPAWSLQLRNIQPGPTLGRAEDPRSWRSFRTVNLIAKAEADSF
jgi:hypothetical protein